MKSTLSLVSVCVVAAGLALAADYTPVTKEAGNITTLVANTANVVRVNAGRVSATNVVTFSQSVTATNGATITPAANVVLVTASGQDDGFTNTVTLASATDGMRVTLVVLAASSNLLAIADSGTAKLSGAAELGDDDVIELIGVGTNWHQVSKTAN